MDIDLTPIVVAIVAVCLPSILRAIADLYAEYRADNLSVASRLEAAADFAVRAAQIWRETYEKSGADAEGYAVEAAQQRLDRLGIKVDAQLVLDAIRAAYYDFARAAQPDADA